MPQTDPANTASINIDAATLRSLGLTTDDVPDVAGAMDNIERGEVLQTVAGLTRKNKRLRGLLERQTSNAREQTQFLENLLDSQSTLCHLHDVSDATETAPYATVRTNGQFQEVRIHPSINIEELKALGPLDYVRVSNDHLVIGVRRADAPGSASLHQRGDVAEFKSYHDEAEGVVVVHRDGHGIAIARLAPGMTDTPLTDGMQVILHRDEPSWVVDVIEVECAGTKFETPLDGLNTTLNDLAGLDELGADLVESILMRVAYPALREEFALKPLGGILLTSRKAGMGKTTLIRALIHDLGALGAQAGFDVALFHIKPNQLKTVWHGGDARNVRELFAGVRARCAKSTQRTLCFVVFDEIDSLGSRADGQQTMSSAQNDVVQSMLAEMDGLERVMPENADVVYIGMTTREELVDAQLRRPGRFGGVVRAIPDYDARGAEHILMLGTGPREGRSFVPWWIDGRIVTDVDADTLRRELVGPAAAAVFDTDVLTYSTERERHAPVSAGRILAAVHYENAMTEAKRVAAARKLHANGIPAVTADDLTNALLTEAGTEASKLAADHHLLRRILDVNVPVTTAEVIPADQYRQHRYVRLSG